MDLRIGHMAGPLGETQVRALVSQLSRLLPNAKVTAVPVQDPGAAPYCEGVFASPLEIVLLNSEVEAIVGSLQDIGVLLPEGLKLAAVTQRIDIRDAAVTVEGLPLRAMPEGTQVVVDGPRRAHQIGLLRADLEPVIVQIRPDRLLESIGAGNDQAGIVSMSDLCWMKQDTRAAEILSVDEMLPGAGQGALGIVVREIDTFAEKAMLAVNHKSTWACVRAERAVVGALGWSSCAPVASLAQIEGGQLKLRASAFAPRGSEIACAEGSAAADDWDGLAKKVADDLLRAGGDRIIRESRTSAL